MSFFGVDINENREDYLYQLTYYGLSKFIYDTGLFEDLNVRDVFFFKTDIYVMAHLEFGYKNEYSERLKFIYYADEYIKNLLSKYSLNFKYEINDAKNSDSLIELTFKVTPSTTFRNVFRIDDKKINAEKFQPNVYCNEEIQYHVSDESQYILNLSSTPYSTYDNFLGEGFYRFVMRHNRLSKVVCQWRHNYSFYTPIYESFSDIIKDVPLLDEIDIIYPQYPSYMNCGISKESFYCIKANIISDIPWDKFEFEKTLKEFWNEALIKKYLYGDVSIVEDTIHFVISSTYKY